MKTYELRVNGEFFQVDVLGNDKSLQLLINGKEVSIDLLNESSDEDNNTPTINYTRPISVAPAATTTSNPLPTPSPSSNTSGTLKSQIPGKVTAVLVSVGDNVKSGQKLIIMEAMKMENELYADRDGVVSELLVKVGDTVNIDTPLLSY